MSTKNTILWTKSHKPWVNINIYIDKETGEIIEPKLIPDNYIIIKIEKNVKTTRTNRIAERTIICRKPEYKQQQLF